MWRYGGRVCPVFEERSKGKERKEMKKRDATSNATELAGHSADISGGLSPESLFRLVS